MNKLFTIFILFLHSAAYSQSQYITTIAGTGTNGFSGDGGPARSAKLSYVRGAAVDTAGNVYFCDATTNGRIRKVNTSGIITTIGGNGYGIDTGDGGPATAAGISGFVDVAVDRAGNVYVSCGGNRIRKISPMGIITTVAGNGTGSAYSGDGGPATAAGFGAGGIGVDDTGNLYIADNSNARIRKVNTAGIISTVAGNGTIGYSGDGGPATLAKLNGPWDVTVDKTGNIFIAEELGNRVRKVTPAGIISTYAGTGIHGETGDGGPATSADADPYYIATDDSGSVYYASNASDVVRKITTSGIIVTVAGKGVGYTYNGDGIPATSAGVGAIGLALDKNGNIYMADGGNYRIRKTYTRTAGVPAIHGYSQGAVTVMPNPSYGTFTVQLPKGINAPVQLVITDLAGHSVKEIEVDAGVTQKDVQLTVPPGMYFINAVTEQGKWCSKVVVE